MVLYRTHKLGSYSLITKHYCHLQAEMSTADLIVCTLPPSVRRMTVCFFFLDNPKFPKEKLNPVEVDEGQPFILKCDPPKGIPPLQIYWMSISK